MYSNSNISGALPIYAQHLSEATGVKVVINGDGAFTDGEVVNVPFVRDGDASLAFGFMAHECSHVRNTDMDVFRSTASTPMRKHLLNILEDIRIERLSMDQYPGTEGDIRHLNRKVLLEPFRTPKKPHPLEIINNAILYGAYWRLQEPQLEKPARVYLDLLADLVGKPLADDIMSVACQCLGCANTAEVLVLVDRIIAMLPSQGQGESQGQDQGESQGQGQGESQGQDQGESQGQGQGESQGQDQGESQGQDQGESQGQGQGESQGQGQGESQGQGQGESQGQDQGESQGQDQGESQGQGQSESQGQGQGQSQGQGQGQDLKQMLLSATEKDLDGLIADVGDQAAQMLDREADRLGVTHVFSVTGNTGGRPASQPSGFKDQILEKGSAASAGLRQALGGLLQGKTNCRVRLKRQGRRIDTGRIAMLRAGETRIFRSKAEAQRQTAAVQFLLDGSGSMNANKAFVEAEAALYAVLKSLEGLPQVTSGALRFPSVYINNGVPTVGCERMKGHDQRLSSAESHFGLHPYGSTPLGESLWAAAVELFGAKTAKSDRKILFVITDGEPDDIGYAAKMVRLCEKGGIEVIGLGFGGAKEANLMRVFRAYRDVGSVNALRAALFELVREVLAA